MFFLTYGKVTYVDPVDYCAESVEHLTLEQKIEVSIGCSTVNGKRTYSDRRLKWLLNDGKPYNTKLRIKAEEVQEALKLPKETK